MTNSFMNKYFGPLPRDYCIYFYIMSIMFGILLALSAISMAIYIVTHLNKLRMPFVINGMLVLFNLFLGYIANRLLHTMCIKAI